MGLGMPADLVRGQYAGYRDEPRVAKDSDVETYCDLWCRVLKGRALGERRTIRPARGTLNASQILLIAVRCLALAGAVWATLPGAQAQPRYTVSAEQLQQAVAQRFPLRYPVAGLLNLDVQVPRLRLLPEQNRLSAEMAVEAAGPALERSHAGTFEMDFALRYEASDRTIRAHQLRFKRLRFADLQPAASELLNTYGPALTEQSLHEVVVHQLRPQDLALADTMGLQPGVITVTDKGLVIGFVVKPL